MRECDEDACDAESSEKVMAIVSSVCVGSRPRYGCCIGSAVAVA
eukprot:CAMPEP_0172375028 /NCGR_PEP_ID=MMETSP1060-20121228/59020_1 /TAXON_ID=37318 /ORGANISM="Pseudo-nitzschia pungens, Strain cf. cingulata" /LENGTH=43 /DNA_ID= /DNA_START= /DNA_END= /DNA_ORIENTATION=